MGQSLMDWPFVMTYLSYNKKHNNKCAYIRIHA